MTIAVFLDTNIIVNDYKMEKQEFSDFFELQKELSMKDDFEIMLTDMNYHEVIANYKKEISKVITQFRGFSGSLEKISEIKIEGLDRNNLKNSLLQSYIEKINDLFTTYEPPSESHENAIKRLYSGKMPFRDNKEEFKDAIIWESISSYACDNPDEKIYFISGNHKDFAVKSKDGTFKLHPDFDDLDNRIKYFNSINDFLKEIEFLKVHDFSFQETEEVLKIIKSWLEENAHSNWEIELELHSFFLENHFREDIYEGWGTDYSIEEIQEVELNDYNIEILEHNNYFYIPITAEVKISYAVETSNPVYEKGYDDDQFIQSTSREDDFLLQCVALYNVETKEIEKIEDVEIDFL